MRLRTLAVAIATMALSTPVWAPAAAAPKDTETFHVRSLDLHFFGTDTASDPCLVANFELHLGAFEPTGYNINFWVDNVCTGERVLDAATPETEYSEDAFTFKRNLSQVSVELSGPVAETFTGDVVGTFSLDTTISLSGVTTPAGRQTSILCFPLEVDPETGEALPGTLYELRRETVAFSHRLTQVTSATGTLTVRLQDGTTYEFLGPGADVGGTLDASVFNVLQQVSVLEQCPKGSPRG